MKLRLASITVGTSLAFALDQSSGKSRVVLPSKWETGRRFALARILGDQLAYRGRDALHAATHAYTYRQRLQRSFAAELLCPYEAVDDFLQGDFGTEAVEDAAAHFNVSTMTVQTMLANRGEISKDGLRDVDAEAA